MKISEFLKDYEHDCRGELITLMLEPERNNRKIKLLTAYIAQLEDAIQWQQMEEEKDRNNGVAPYGEDFQE